MAAFSVPFQELDENFMPNPVMDSTSPFEPKRFGRYILIDRLGRGGMAEVFRAVMPGVEGFRRDLVIKQIRPDQSHTPNFIAMFVHEARISALLHHPNIVQVFDFGQVDGCYFLAMELLRGRDLLAIMKALRERRLSFPVAIAAHVGQQVALGLGYAHSMHAPDNQPLEILHRDVSPSNIMCLSTGGVKLLDFGIASALGEIDASEGEESTFKGKLSYMAPERLGLGAQQPPGAAGEGVEAKLDGRIDLFALGTVLWEVIAGRRLFQGRTDAEKLRAIVEKPIPPLDAMRPDVPARLNEIVMKALERDPDRRYLSAQVLADDLEEVAIGGKYQSRMLPSLLQDLFGPGGSGSHVAISHLPPELLSVAPTFSSGAQAVEPLATTSKFPRALVALEPPATLGEGAPSARPPWRFGRAWIRLDPRARRRLGIIALAAVAMLLGLGLSAAISRGENPGQDANGGLAVAVAAASASASASRRSPPSRVSSVTTAAPPPAPAPTNALEASSLSDAKADSRWGPPSDSTAQKVEPPAVIATAPATPAPVTRARGGSREGSSLARGAALTGRASASRASTGRVTQGLSIDPFAEAAARRTRSPPPD